MLPVNLDHRRFPLFFGALLAVACAGPKVPPIHLPSDDSPVVVTMSACAPRVVLCPIARPGDGDAFGDLLDTVNEIDEDSFAAAVRAGVRREEVAGAVLAGLGQGLCGDDFAACTEGLRPRSMQVEIIDFGIVESGSRPTYRVRARVTLASGQQPVRRRTHACYPDVPVDRLLAAVDSRSTGDLPPADEIRAGFVAAAWSCGVLWGLEASALLGLEPPARPASAAPDDGLVSRR